MTIFTRTFALLALLIALAAPVTAAFAQVPAQPEQQDEFTPIEQLPPQDQLPAAPLLVAAYSIVLLALFFYVFSVARRLGSVQQEMSRLEGDLRKGRRP